MGRKQRMGNHHGWSRPDAQMGSAERDATSAVRRVIKKRANAKRRRRDKEAE